MSPETYIQTYTHNLDQEPFRNNPFASSILQRWDDGHSKARILSWNVRIDFKCT